jgi:hypothetical protein
VLQSTLENLLCNDLALLIGDPGRDGGWGAARTIGTVDPDTRIDLDERIRNSLRWFREVLSEPSSTPALPFRRLLEPLHDPATQRVTTPAYLVVQALLGSYLGFTQPHYHNFLSSVLARDELMASGYPEAFANAIAALIEFQNSVRTALLGESEREIGLWTGWCSRRGYRSDKKFVNQ